MPELRVAHHGEDLIGRIDELLQLARRGWSGRLFVKPDVDALRPAVATNDVIGDADPVGSIPSAAYREAAATVPTRTGVSGPVLALSGSRSTQTRRQMDTAAAADWFVHPLELEPSRAASQLDWVLSALRAGRSVGLTSDDSETPGVGGAGVAEAAAAIAAGAVAAGATRRVIVCGGDTSSRVTRLLGVESLSIAANPWGEVALLTAHSPDPAIDGLELLLEGGEAGADDLFVRVRALGT